MRQRLVLVLVAGIAFIAFGSASSGSERRYVQVCLRAMLAGNPCVGSLGFDVGGSLMPKRQPPHELVPVGLAIHGEIGNEGGGHPSALREAELTVDEGVAIDGAGLGTCPRRRLENRGVAAARRLCRKAVVGRGSARIGFASSGTSVTTALTLFNGGTSSGVTRLFVHGAAAQPKPMPIVAVVEVRRRQAGLEGVLRVPPILDGDGSLLEFELEIERRLTRGGAKRSYLNANCRDGRIDVNLRRALFRNEAKIPGVGASTTLKGSLTLPCTPDRRS
jgi:hypothetical protein